MWPWEHAAVGYLGYSLALRLLGHPPPSDRETLVLVTATILPDLIDKPFSWSLNLAASGHGPAHSVFLAVPIGIAIGLVAWRRERKRIGAVAVLGHWSHLIGDVVSPIRMGDPPNVRRVLWPVVEPAPYETHYGLRRGLVYFTDFLATIAASDPIDILIFYALVPALTVGLWVIDGAPGSRRLRLASKTVWNALQ